MMSILLYFLLFHLIDKFHFVRTSPSPLFQVSTVYNRAIATSDTDIIVNSVIVLFVMDLDEWIFASLKACNKSWTAHASDSDSSSDAQAEKEGAIKKMKEEIALQKAQIASQQEELMLQKDQMARQNDEIAKLSESMQRMQESFAVVSAAAAATMAPESIPQSPSNESVTSYTVELEDTNSDADLGKDMSVNEVEDLNQVEKVENAL